MKKHIILFILFFKIPIFLFTTLDSKMLVRKGMDKCEVSLWFDNGTEIIWTRYQGKSSGTTKYLVNGVLFTKVGRNVIPESVAAIVSPWIVGGVNSGFIQIHEQGLPPFLTTKMNATTGRAWDFLEGKSYREILDNCKANIRKESTTQSSCLKKLSYYKDNVDVIVSKLDSIYILSRKFVGEISGLLSFLLRKKLAEVVKVEVSFKELQKALFYSLFQEIKSIDPAAGKSKVVANLLKVLELKNSMSASKLDLNLLQLKMGVIEEEVELTLECPFYKKTKFCVLLKEMLGEK